MGTGIFVAPNDMVSAVLVINGVSIWAILVMNIIWFCNLELGVSFLKKLLFKVINRAGKSRILS